MTLYKSIRKTFAFSMLLFVLFSFWTFAVSPILSFWEDKINRNERLAFKLSRYDALFALEEEMDRQSEQLEGQVSAAGFLRKNETSAMVAASLQAQIRRVVGDLNGTVLRTADLPPIAAHKNLKRVGIRVNCEGDQSVLLGVLSAGKTDRPIWFIDNLNVRAPEFDQSSETTTTKKLAIGFDAYGYVSEEGP